MSTKPHFSILATSFAGGPRQRNVVMIVCGLWLLLFFAALFSPPILDDADATHANAARAMATTGDLVTMRVDGVRYLEKAPLPYWLVAASFRLFGFNTFAAHLPQAIAVLLLMLVGHRWANQAFGARTGFYTAVGVLTSVGVFLFTRILIPEVLLSLFLGAALFALLKTLGPVAVDTPRLGVSGVEARIGETPERPAIAWYAGPLFYPYVMWGSLALAVLTKGLVALVFFMTTAILFLGLTGDWNNWRKLRPVSGGLLFLMIAAPWHVLAGIRNTGGSDGHGFWWFYFWNEHVLRFLGRREPRDFNKLPGWAYWAGHLIWLFPWSLFLPLGIGAVRRRYAHQAEVLTRLVPPSVAANLLFMVAGVAASFALLGLLGVGWSSYTILILAASVMFEVGRRRRGIGLPGSPFHRIDPQQRTILLLSLFAGIILVFFSLSTNQEYYTFPAYMPILLLIAATITRAEQTYSTSGSARRWIGVAHIALMVVGGAVAVVLAYGLWSSRHLAYVFDIGAVMARRGVGDYTLSMSHVFDLTTETFAGLRLPAVLAALSLMVGPLLAWMLRAQRRHLAATTAVAFTAAGFLLAAHIALARFAPLLSSEAFAAKIQQLRGDGEIERTSQVLLYGDQAYGSSIPFYLGEQVGLVDGRSTSMLFGASFGDAPRIFMTGKELADNWGRGERKVLFVPAEQRDQVNRLLGARQFVIETMSGKALVTDRPLEGLR